MASDKLGILRSKKHHSVRHIFGPHQPTFQGVSQLYHLILFLIFIPQHVLQQWRPNQPWRNTIHAYPIRAQVHARAPHQPQHRVLHARRHSTRVHRHELVVSSQVQVQHALIARVGCSSNAGVAEHDVQASARFHRGVY